MKIIRESGNDRYAFRQVIFDTGTLNFSIEDYEERRGLPRHWHLL